MRWKFDSTPDRSVGHFDVGGELVEASETDCFSQQAYIFQTPSDGRKSVAWHLPLPPKAIISGAAKHMMKALDFVPILYLLINLLSEAVLVGDGCMPIVFILNLTHDQHSANLLLVRHLTWKFSSWRDCATAMQSYLLIIASNVCMSHQVSIISRTQYARFGGVSVKENKAFLNGLMGCCHVFSRSSYMTKIYAAVRAIFGQMKRYTAIHAAESGIAVLSDAAKQHTVDVLEFLARTMLGVRELDSVMAGHVRTIVDILNTGIGSMVHVCIARGACVCQGEPVQKIMKSIKASDSERPKFTTHRLTN
jgi:hypothetical protein